jgi:hypothetical protein
MAAVIKERIMTLKKNGKAGLRLVPDGIEPLLPRMVRDKGPWLNFVFLVPPQAKRQAVALEFFDDVGQYRIAPDHSDLPGDHLEATVSPHCFDHGGRWWSSVTPPSIRDVPTGRRVHLGRVRNDIRQGTMERHVRLVCNNDPCFCIRAIEI